MKKIFILILAFIGINSLYSQSQVGINTNNPHASAVLDIQSTTGGLLIPSMTTAQRNAISSPANGLQVYDTDFQAFFAYSSSGWAIISSIWKLNGHKTYYNAGNVGIGIENPLYTLDIFSSTPTIRIMDEDSIGPNPVGWVIDLDDSDDDIAFNSDAVGGLKKIFSATESGNFGIGDIVPDTSLHIKDRSPFIKYTNNNNKDFYVGLDENDDSYKINTPLFAQDMLKMSSTGRIEFNASENIIFNPGITTKEYKIDKTGNTRYYKWSELNSGSLNLASYNASTQAVVQDSLFNVGTMGGVKIHSAMKIKMIPGIITPEISIYNPTSGDTVDINVSNNGNLNISVPVFSNRDFFINHTFEYDSIVNSTPKVLKLDNITMPLSSPSNYSVIGNEIKVLSEGYYILNYALAVDNADHSTTHHVHIIPRVNGNEIIENGHYMKYEYTFSFSKIIHLNVNDKVSIAFDIDGYNGVNDKVYIYDRSFMELIKISD